MAELAWCVVSDKLDETTYSSVQALNFKVFLILILG